MSDKPDKKPENKEPAAAAGKEEKSGEHEKKAKGGLLKGMPALLGAVMIIEAVVLFAGFKFIGGGAKTAQSAELKDDAKEGGEKGGEHGEGKSEGAPKAATGKWAEIELVDFKAPNSRKGRLMLYQVGIVVSVKTENKDKVKQVISDRDATIKDRVRTIIAQSDPEKLGGGAEPGLETLRRQVKCQLDEIVGEGMIEEVLVTQCTPYQSGV